MRAGIVAALFLSAVFVQARPAPEQKRDIVDTVTSAAEQIFSSDIAPVLSGITPEIETLFGEATSALGGFFASNTALGHEATAIVSAFESKATQIEQDVASKNGAPAIRGSASGPLGLGLATALGSALLGAYVIL
ncbi:uncharacterized protein TRAVEDRAFT_67785 [Trametes versicolor FP-101664 SS1]|uniref:uncharacterized protein n=1 Tax=Trametes versicolor (strain FP-101664) TaxID=717944 RepID=UPI000462432A|nr:uncharacterized protein TRAVEDRAFT_67785 [Trametes versicolor FP-101664 SS1]EIW63786.1 hypothetical protein TRAVEDRAFT_67785 [Trametes versicolor FP-101664 SS1]